MFKRNSLLGALCIFLMGLWAANVDARPPSLSGWGWTGSQICFNSTWTGSGNTDQAPTHYGVTLIPNDMVLIFSNPTDHTGGQEAVTFTNDRVSVTLGSEVDFTNLKGRGKIEDQLCFNTNDLLGLFAEESGCDSSDSACLNEYVLDMYAPNDKWTLLEINIDNFDSIVEAFSNVNTFCEDGEVYPSSGYTLDPSTCYGAMEEVVHAHFYGCQHDEALHEYICSQTAIWGYKNNDPVPYPFPSDSPDHSVIPTS